MEECQVCEHYSALNEVSNGMETYYLCNTCTRSDEFADFTITAEADGAPYYPDVE
jgi:hypothetical protein